MNTHYLPHWHRGLHALHFGLLGGLVAVTFFGALFMTALSPLWVQPAQAAVSVFSGGVWNTPVPSYTSLSEDSTGLVANIVGQVNTYGAAINRDSAASTIYQVDSNTPPVTVVPYDCGNGIPAELASQWQNVPVPFFAVPSSGGQMVVYQPSSGTIWEFGHMRNVSGQWQACTGGQIASSGSGVFASPYGITSSGLAMLGGQLSIQELQSGVINHVVGLNLPRTNGVTWPATQSGGGSSGAPAMGTRLRLDPSLDVNSLGLSSAALAIARAAQTYGIIVWNGGGNVGFTAESAVSSTARGLPDPYAGINTGLAGFPWDKLQALPTNYGQSGGIPIISKFSASQTDIKADNKVTLNWQATNVNRCAIAGLADNLASSGSMQTNILKDTATFVLRCGGPAGTATSQVTVWVTPILGNDSRRELGSGSLIDQPYAGYANVLPDLMGLLGDGVYKVVYYEQQTYLYETATPPFALNTLRMPNGKHTVSAKLYFRDGRTDQRVLGVSVDNKPETIGPITQSSVPKTPYSLPLAWGVLGGLSAITVMGAGTWWGWRKAHLV